MLIKMNLGISLLFLLATLVCYFIPDVDINVSKLFFQENQKFMYADNIVVNFLFQTVPVVTFSYATILIFFAFFLSFKNGFSNRFILIITTILAIIISSGVIVNLTLKDNFGRARPEHIAEFGGEKQFTKVFQISDQCYKNCSFSSGHAAAAFNITSTAFLFSGIAQYIVFIVGLLYGILVGIGRILQGGHFISDVAASGFIVLCINYVCFSLYFLWAAKKEFLQNSTLK